MVGENVADQGWSWLAVVAHCLADHGRAESGRPWPTLAVKTLQQGLRRFVFVVILPTIWWIGSPLRQHAASQEICAIAQGS